MPLRVARSQVSAFGDHLRPALELNPADGRLNVGQAVAVAEDRIRFGNNLSRRVTDMSRHAHALLAPALELRVPLAVVVTGVDVVTVRVGLSPGVDVRVRLR